MNIKIKPTIKQLECWNTLLDNKTRNVFFGGGAGGGKSWCGCEWILSMCINYPDTHWFIGRSTLQALRKSTLETFFKVCRYHGVDSSNYKYNSQQNFILFINGSKIDLLDLKYNPSDPDFASLGSTEYTGGFIDEIGDNIKQLAYETLKSRCGRWNNDKYDLLPKILCSLNPSKNWVYNEIYLKDKQGTLPEDTKFIHALFTDNKYTAKSYGEQLAGIKNEAQRERLMNGNWEYDDDDNKIVKYENILDLFTNTIDKNGEKYITCDVARFGSDTTTIAVWEDMELTNLFIHNGESTTTTASRIKELAREYKIPYSHIVIDENGIGGGVIDQLNGVKGFINNSTPFITRRNDKTNLNNDSREIKENFASLKDQCYFHLADYINNHKIALRVTAEQEENISQELDACLRVDKIDNDGKQRIIRKDKVKDIIGRSPDIADTIMMRMYFELNERRINHVNIEDYYRIRRNERETISMY